MGSNESRAKTIGAAILATAAVTAAATTVVFSLRTAPPPPVVTQRSIVYVPVALPGSSAGEPANAPTQPLVGRAQLTSGELAGASGSDTTDAPDSEQASSTEQPAAPGYSLSDVLEGARAKLEALGAAALSSTPAPVETPAVLAEAAQAPAQETPPPPALIAQQDAVPEQPVVGAGPFTTPPPYGASAWQSNPNAGAGQLTTPAPYSASAWQSNPNAGAGQFSTDKGSIDPSIGAGPFTTEWHTPPSFVLVYPY